MKHISVPLVHKIFVKVGMFIGLTLWGLILYHDFPESISYISILYGMAIQFWVSCVICVILGLSGNHYVICLKPECDHRKTDLMENNNDDNKNTQ